MQATVELLDLKPAAIEHIDRPLLDQTKGQLHFQAARDLLELDTKPCESILIVEFYEMGVRGPVRALKAATCRRTPNRRRRTIVDLAIEKNRTAHKDSDRSGANEHGLVRAQIRSVTFDRMRRTCKTGCVYRRRRCSSRAIAGVRARIAIDNETAGA